MNNPSFGVEKDFFEIDLTPGEYELAEIKGTIKQKISTSCFEVKLEADTISM